MNRETKSLILLIIGIGSFMFAALVVILSPFAFGYNDSPYCEYDEAYCITGKPDPDLTPREIQYYCLLLDASQRPSFCFKETLDFSYRMTPELNRETILLTLCIHSQVNMPHCNLLYGSIDKPYGDAITK